MFMLQITLIWFLLQNSFFLGESQTTKGSTRGSSLADKVSTMRPNIPSTSGVKDAGSPATSNSVTLSTPKMSTKLSSLADKVSTMRPNIPSTSGVKDATSRATSNSVTLSTPKLSTSFSSLADKVSTKPSDIPSTSGATDVVSRATSNSVTSSSLTSDCPEGFFPVENSIYCYRLITEKFNWTISRQLCSYAAGNAQLTVIQTEAEHKAIAAFLAVYAELQNVETDCSTASGILVWTSGRRLDFDCDKSFVWSPFNGTDIPMNYTAWDEDQPDCWQPKEKQEKEACVEVKANSECKFNDLFCTERLCPLCQVRRST